MACAVGHAVVAERLFARHRHGNVHWESEPHLYRDAICTSHRVSDNRTNVRLSTRHPSPLFLPLNTIHYCLNNELAKDQLSSSSPAPGFILARPTIRSHSHLDNNQDLSVVIEIKYWPQASHAYFAFSIARSLPLSLLSLSIDIWFFSDSVKKVVNEFCYFILKRIVRYIELEFDRRVSCCGFQSPDTQAWQNDYLQGTGCEMYTETLSPSFTGMSFPQASE